MGLVLTPAVNAPGNHKVMHGEWQLGEIDKRPPLTGTEPRWMWALNGVPKGPKDIRLTGVASTIAARRASAFP
jgi:hypothetical protein